MIKPKIKRLKKMICYYLKSTYSHLHTMSKINSVYRYLDVETRNILKNLPEWVRVSRYRTYRSSCPWKYRVTLTSKYPIHALNVDKSEDSKVISKAFNVPPSDKISDKKKTPSVYEFSMTFHRVIRYHMAKFHEYLECVKDGIQWSMLGEASDLTDSLQDIITESDQIKIYIMMDKYEKSNPYLEYEDPLTQEDITSSDESDYINPNNSDASELEYSDHSEISDASDYIIPENSENSEYSDYLDEYDNISESEYDDMTESDRCVIL